MLQISRIVTQVIYYGYRIKCGYNGLDESVVICQLCRLNGNTKRYPILITDEIGNFNQLMELNSTENNYDDNIYGK
jgi:hypothetical protein